MNLRVLFFMLLVAAIVSSCGSSNTDLSDNTPSVLTQLCDCYEANRTSPMDNDRVMNACLDSVGLRTVPADDSVKHLGELHKIVKNLMDSCLRFSHDLSLMRDTILIYENASNLSARIDSCTALLFSTRRDSALYERANLWIKMQKFDSAKHDLALITAGYRTDQVLFCRIYCNEKLGYFDSARDDCDEYEKLKPDRAYFLRGLLNYTVRSKQ